jgi:hypothetical protein
VKKIAVGCLLFYMGLFCFAKGQRDSFEIGIGYHHSASGTEEENTTIPSFAINFAGITFYTEKVGIGVYGNLIFPQEFRWTSQGQSTTVDKSAYDFFFSMDFLFGPAFVLYKSETIYVPLSFGLSYSHFRTNVADVFDSISHDIGLGSTIAGEFHFNPSVYAYGRFQFSYGFYAWGTNQQHGSPPVSSSTNLIEWGPKWAIEPCIGIGFQL